MCGPIGIGALKAAGSIYSGYASAASYNGQAAAFNAEKKAQLYQAQSEVNAGSYESAIKLDEGKRLLGKQVTGLAATGVDVASGSAADIITDSASNVNMDVAAIRHNWQDKANLSTYAAKIAKLNAKVAKNNARSAVIGGYISAATNMAEAISDASTKSASGGTNTSGSFGG